LWPAVAVSACVGTVPSSRCSSPRGRTTCTTDTTGPPAPERDSGSSEYIGVLSNHWQLYSSLGYCTSSRIFTQYRREATAAGPPIRGTVQDP
jgi:hypothetical protein